MENINNKRNDPRTGSKQWEWYNLYSGSAGLNSDQGNIVLYNRTDIDRRNGGIAAAEVRECFNRGDELVACIPGDCYIRYWGLQHSISGDWITAIRGLIHCRGGDAMCSIRILHR